MCAYIQVHIDTCVGNVHNFVQNVSIVIDHSAVGSKRKHFLGIFAFNTSFDVIRVGLKEKQLYESQFTGFYCNR